MRIVKIIGCLVLTVLLVLLVLHMLGWRRPQPTITFIGPALSSLPVLQIGEVLEWENSDPNTSFTINFMYGFSPCNDTTIPSKVVSGIQTATCTVVAVPPPNSNFYYYIETNHEIKQFQQSARPCTGCVYGTDPSTGDAHTRPITGQGKALVSKPLAGSGNPIAIACETNGGVKSITINPTTSQPPSEGPAVLTWGPLPNALDWTLDFDPNNNPCPAQKQLSGKNNSCDFTGDATYPYKYTVKVPSCGANLTADGVVNAPSAP
jgi:hypothetical protein